MEQTNKQFHPTRLISQAAVEWAGILSLLVAHLRQPKIYHETPPLHLAPVHTPEQIPILFIPSPHMGASVFNLALWRFKKHFWLSLWPFQWKPFLQDPLLLEDQLKAFIQEVLKKTEAPVFRVISFGSSYPIVAKSIESFSQCDKWVAISSSKDLSAVMNFLSAERVKEAYQKLSSKKIPNLVIRGENDTVCYPASLFSSEQELIVPEIGHFGCLLHSSTIRKLLKEFS